MELPLVEALALPISRIRLEAYRPQDGSDFEMLVNYLWNVGLSDALYPCLKMFEVALRNSIHTAMSDYFETEFWFESDFLHDWQLKTVREAKEQLTTHNKPHEPGRIVAELSFGFGPACSIAPMRHRCRELHERRHLVGIGRGNHDRGIRPVVAQTIKRILPRWQDDPVDLVAEGRIRRRDRDQYLLTKIDLLTTYHGALILVDDHERRIMRLALGTEERPRYPSDISADMTIAATRITQVSGCRKTFLEIMAVALYSSCIRTGDGALSLGICIAQAFNKT